MDKTNYAYQKRRGLERKLYFIRMIGGRCTKCGYDKNLAGLDFHHTNPENKEFRLDSRSMSNRSVKEIENEIKKCILLCANCHREEHYPEQNMVQIESEITEFKSIKNRERHYKLCSICGAQLSYGNRESRCKECSYIQKRKSIWPSKSQLEEDLRTLRSRNKIGKKYNTTHSTVRRWIKYYNIT